jgi:two-component system, cell cycle sensor histidine kinase and response regulator CckA
LPQRAASLTRRLLACSRRQIVQPANVDLAEVVGEVDEMLRYLLGQTIELKVRLTPGICWVRVDPGQIEQIVVNLAVNARDAMPDGGELKLETTTTELAGGHAQQLGLEPGPYAALSVSDTGRGMDPETLRHIFEPFFTTKTSGRGTGLGLATVKAILEQIGGGIAVESEPGRGSTFRAYLPLIDQTIHGTALAAGHERQDLTGSDTILVVENDEPVRAVLGTILEGKGYRVLPVHDAATALEILDAAGADVRLLLTEAVMPGGSGLELAARARAARPGLDVLVMSGYSKDGSSRQIDAEDASVALIQKPFSTDQLLRKLREVLHPA